MTDVWTPALLAAAAPNARILVSLRDPIERYRSALQRPIRVADSIPAPFAETAPHEAFARGLYHQQLLRLFEHVGRERVLVLQYERCVAAPAAELRRTFEFLGLEPVELGEELERHPNRQRRRLELDPRASASLADAYRDDLERLAALCPELDLDLWPTARR
jgi:hypothetical protein